MARKKHSVHGIAGLVKQKASLRAQLAKDRKKKADAKRAAKLKREVEALRGKLKTSRRTRRK